ncbi:MAG: GAF domain-containing protein [Rhodobacteraceae bacterium]|nr:GAF domain-containing protein [Paracoccaceae bacterium]
MKQALLNIAAICAGETDMIANMATISCELFHADDRMDWVGFYRNMGDNTLKIGPYQGGHGCLSIPFSKGVCGAAARLRQTQLVADVDAFSDHIACSSDTRSEIVLPVFDKNDGLIGVLDIDSNQLDAFNSNDQIALESMLREVFATA